MARVLVIRGGAIGDFILTLPAIKLLRDGIPGAHLEILGYPPITSLAVMAGLADATRHLEHGSMARLFVPGAAQDEALADYLRSFNLIVSYLYDPDGYLRGNMERIGVKTFLEASHRVEPGKGHAAEQLAKPLERIAMWLENPAPNLMAMGKDGASPAGQRVAVHPGSGSPKKCLPLEHWLRFGREFAREFSGHRLALITGEAEHERGITDAIRKAWDQLDYEHWDQLPLTELATLLTGCRAFLGHDSGISHLAAACGVPCRLFFGPTDPATWAPRNAGTTVFAEATGDLGAVPYETFMEDIRQLMRRL